MQDRKEQWRTEIWWIRQAEKERSKHFKEQVKERVTEEEDVEAVIRTGEIVQGHAPWEYKDGSNPDPVRVILGYGKKGQPFHLVAALQRRRRRVILVTIYRPSLEYWESDLKTLRRR